MTTCRAGTYMKYFEFFDNVTIKIKDFSKEWKESHPEIINLFDRISEHLPTWSLLHGNNVPTSILYIDKTLDLIISDPIGQNIVKSIFAW